MTQTSEDQPAGLEARMDKLEGKMDEILAKLTAGGGPGPGAGPGPGPSGRPPDMETQVHMELDRRDAARAEAEAAASLRRDVDQAKADLAKLRETRPEPPQPRRERGMWGPRHPPAARGKAGAR